MLILTEPDNQLTEFYDDYLNSYSGNGGEDVLAPLPIRSGGGPAAPPDRVAGWARSNTNLNYALSRSGSRSAPVNNYSSPSGGVRRTVTRRGTTRSRVQSPYDEEEEGYASGDYEDLPFELVKIRVKVSLLSTWIRKWTHFPPAPLSG